MGRVSLSVLKAELETLYHRYHHPEYRKHDPVETLWRYANPRDQELAGLWAALFAWGRREVALRKVQSLLDTFADSPFYALRAGATLDLDWRHRTWSPQDMYLLWERLKALYKAEGSLADFFWRRRANWIGAIAEFQAYLGAPPLHRHIGNLQRGSASKRLLLWLRWMVRRDCIDPGPWEGFSPVLLYVPIDVHVLAWARRYGLLRLRTPSWRSVVELTEIFRQLEPEDPLRYDFAIVTAGSQATFAT